MISAAVACSGEPPQPAVVTATARVAKSIDATIFDGIPQPTLTFCSPAFVASSVDRIQDCWILMPAMIDQDLFRSRFLRRLGRIEALALHSTPGLVLTKEGDDRESPPHGVQLPVAEVLQDTVER
jgi:hypothetical protein